MIVQLYAEVACVDICDHLAWILGCAQESSDEFVETYPFGTGYLDRAVTGAPTVTSAIASATSSDTMGCTRAGDR